MIIRPLALPRTYVRPANNFHDAAQVLLSPDGWVKRQPARSLELKVEGAVTTGADGSFLTLDPKGVLHVHRPDGTLKWTKLVGKEAHPPLADARGHVYVATRPGHVAAYDGESGALRWEKDLGYLSQPPCLAGRDTLGAIQGYNLMSLNTDTGEPRLSRPVPMAIWGQGPVGGPEGNLYAFNSHELKLICVKPDRTGWVYPVGDYVGRITVGADGTVLVPRLFGDVIALDPDQGKKRWSQRPGEDAVTPKVCPDGQGGAFVAKGSTLRHLEPQEGETSWTTELPAAAQDAPVASQEGNLFLKAGGDVVAVEREGGHPRALFPAPGDPLAAAGEGVAATDGNGTVFELSVRQAPREPAGAAGLQDEGDRVRVGGVFLPHRRSR